MLARAAYLVALALVATLAPYTQPSAAAPQPLPDREFRVPLAQPPVPSGGRDDLVDDQSKVSFTRESMRDAAIRSIREHKALIAVKFLVEPPPGRRRWWEQPEVAQWTRQHAIVVRWGESFVKFPAVPYPERASTRRTLPAEQVLGFAVFVGGKQMHMRQPARDPLAMHIRKVTGQPLDPVPPLSATTVLGDLDLMLAAARARDPAWAMLHDRDNPPPPRADLDPPLHIQGDASAPAFTPPAPLPEHRADVLATLKHARASLARGDARTAAGAFTWLWEAGPTADPAWAPFITFMLPDELRSSSAAAPDLQERVRRLRDRAAAALPWAGPLDKLRWLAISHACNEDSIAFLYFADQLEQPDRAALITPTEYHAYSLMIEALGDQAWADHRGDLHATQELLAQSPPASLYPDDAPALHDFIAHLALGRACRAYALALKAGDDASATQAVDLARRASRVAPGVADRALVATALAAGQPDPRHRDMLRRAAAAASTAAESDPLWEHTR